jgi:uncharacterized membrane protein
MRAPRRTRQSDWAVQLGSSTEKEKHQMAKGFNKSGMLLASAVTGLLTLAAPFATATAGDAEAVPCYGVNKCKGVGDCGGKGHSCAGENACKGQGYLKMDKETCLKIEGGRLTAEKEKE